MSDIIESSSDDNDDRDLDFVRNIRMGLIDQLYKPGEAMTPESVNQLAGLLNDMDRVSLGKKRIKTDAGIANAQALAAAMVLEIVSRPDIKTLGIDPHKVREDVPKIPDLDVPVRLIPGEMDVGVSTLDYAKFTSGLKESE